MQQADGRDARHSALEQWLRDRAGLGKAASLSPFTAPDGTGNSAETLFADLRGEIDGRPAVKHLVIRRHRSGSELFLDSTIELPFRMMEALSRHPSVPSPVVVGVETDASLIGDPFLVSERTEGKVINQVPNPHVSGWLAKLPPEDRRRAWTNNLAVMADLHKLDWKDGFAFLDDAERGPPGLEQYLAYSRDWYHWARAGRDLPVGEAALDYLERNMPKDQDVSVLWGDPAPYNTLFDDELNVTTIVDFEMCALGPGEVDLAWWLAAQERSTDLAGVPRLDGIPGSAEIIDIYGELRGRPAAHMDYYRMFAYFRGYACLLRLAERMEAAGIVPLGSDLATHNMNTRLMAEQLHLEPIEPGEGYRAMLTGRAGASANRRT